MINDFCRVHRNATEKDNNMLYLMEKICSGDSLKGYKNILVCFLSRPCNATQQPVKGEQKGQLSVHLNF